MVYFNMFSYAYDSLNFHFPYKFRHDYYCLPFSHYSRQRGMPQ